MKIQILSIIPKTPASYDFARQGRAGNPSCLHPLNYKPVRTLELPPSIRAARVRSGEQIDELAEFLRERGVRGAVQVRECAGAFGRHKMRFKQGTFSGRGFPVLVRRMEL